MTPPRARRLAGTALLLLALSPAARAVEIPPPPPLQDLGAADGRTLLARWSRRAAPESADELVTSTPATAGDGLAPLIVGADGRPALVSPFDATSRVPPRPLDTPADAAPFGGFGVVRGAELDASPDAAPGEALPGALGSPSLGGARFDVRTEERNPITLPGDALDELTARVVRTPEPGTLALFALGAAGLVALAARRRRRAR